MMDCTKRDIVRCKSTAKCEAKLITEIVAIRSGQYSRFESRTGLQTPLTNLQFKHVN